MAVCGVVVKHASTPSTGVQFADGVCVVMVRRSLFPGVMLANLDDTEKSYF